MESMLTGDSFSGVAAAELGWANRAYREDELEEHVLAIAARIAEVPSDLVQINKRTVHRAMDVMGMRSSFGAGTELSALATHSETIEQFIRGSRRADGGRRSPSATVRSATTAPRNPATARVTTPPRI